MAEQYNSSPLRKILGFVSVAIVTALSIYCAWTYSGPYRWIAEAQLRWFGSYETQITFILSLAVIAAPFLIVIFIWNKAAKSSLSSDLSAPAKPSPVAMPVSDVAVKRFMGNYAMPLTMGVVAAVFGFMSIRDYSQSSRAQKISEVRVSDLEQGRAPDSTWIALTGRKLLDSTQGVEESYSKKYFIPVVSQNWKPGSPVAAFIQASASSADDDLHSAHITRHQGLINSSGLPGMVRVAFEKDGLTPAPNYILLEYGRTPADSRKSARDMLIAAAACAAIGLAFFIYDRFKFRTASPSQPAPAKTYTVKNVLPIGAASRTDSDPSPDDLPPST